MLEPSSKIGNLNQDYIKPKIMQFLDKYGAQDRNDSERLETLKDIFINAGGYCSGMSTLYSYSRYLLETYPKPVADLESDSKSIPRDDYTWFEATIKLISDWGDSKIDLDGSVNKKKREEIWRYIEQIEYFQHITSYTEESLVDQGDLAGSLEDSKDNKPRSLKQEYAIASLLTLEQLKTLLKTENLIQAGKLIYITSDMHAVSLFKDSKGYHFFDPNCKDCENGELERVTDSTDLVAEWLFQSMNFWRFEKGEGFIWNTPSPLAFRMFSFDDQPKVAYPFVQQVLTQIQPTTESSFKSFIINGHEIAYAGGYSSLEIAVVNNAAESLKYFLSQPDFKEEALLKNCPEEDKAQHNLVALLTQALRRNYPNVIEVLLDYKLDLLDSFQINRLSALEYAAGCGFAATVKVLLEKKPDLITQKSRSFTALMYAAENSHTKAVQELLDKGAKVEQTDYYGDTTALSLAASAGHIDVFKILLKQLENKPEIIKQADKDGMTALLFAAQNGCLEIVKELLTKMPELIDQKDARGMTALMLAAEKDKDSVVKELLAKNSALIDQVIAWNGETVLMIAAENGSADTLKILLTAKPELIDLVTKNGKTALKCAVQSKQFNIVKELLVRGANLQNKEAVIDLMALIPASDSTYADIVQLLADYVINNLPLKKFGEQIDANSAKFTAIKNNCPQLHKCIQTNALAAYKTKMVVFDQLKELSGQQVSDFTSKGALVAYKHRVTFEKLKNLHDVSLETFSSLIKALCGATEEEAIKLLDGHNLLLPSNDGPKQKHGF